MTREEAINLVKQVLPCLNVDEKIREGFKTLIPELRESEDERIRKSIIHILQVGGYMSPEEKDKAFAYLEKQKEQKPLTAEETELNSIAFLEQMGYTCIPPGKEQRLTESRKRNKPKESWLSKAKYEIEHADELLRQRQEELREIRELKQKEQKPKDITLSREDCLHQLFENGTITMADYLYLTTNRRKQKPAEKQDYSGLNDFERAIHRGFLSAGMDNFPATVIKETAKECLAQMKSAEWSDEDEKMLTELLLTIEPSNNYDEMRNWLLLKLKALLLQGSKDSLQTSWKPSEEQMSMLLAVINDPNNAGAESCYMALKSIYNNLKKL